MDDDVLVWPSADHAAGSTTSHQHEALRAWVAARGDRRAKRQIVITDQTRHYRAAAKALAGASERAIELGSSYGDCLKVLHARCGGAARGVDISTTAVADAARRFPCLADSMEVMDCIHETERFAALTHGATLAFVDIGGDRHGDTVVRLIASDALQDVPVVVVKSQMHRSRPRPAPRAHLVRCKDARARVGFVLLSHACPHVRVHHVSSTHALDGVVDDARGADA